MSDSDGDIVGDSASPPSDNDDVLGVERMPARRGERVRAGPLRIFVLLSTAAGLWDGIFQYPPAAWALSDGQKLVVGVALVRWTLVPLDAPTRHSCMRDHVRQRSAAGRGLGYLEYVIHEVAVVSEPFLFDDNMAALRACLFPRRVTLLDVAGRPGGAERVCGETLHDWWANGARRGLTTVELGPSLATAVCVRAFPFLSCVLITRRTRRRSTLVWGEPSRRTLNAFVQDMLAGGDQEANSNEDDGNNLGLGRRRRWPDQLDAALVIEWVRATAHLRELRQAWGAARSFARLFAQAGRFTVGELLKDVRFCSPELLRMARVRLDIVQMLYFRRFFKDILDRYGEERVCLYLHADSSPQWRGVEMFAASFDLVVNTGHITSIFRRQFPLISLSRDRGDAVGKGVTLLWQIWLLTGPVDDLFDSFLRCVRSLTTDLGTERLIANLQDMRIDFVELLADVGKGISHQYIERDFLFPSCIQTPGWQHCFDLLIRKGLSSLIWFPSWVEKLKAMVWLLRSQVYVDVLLKRCQEQRWAGIADLLRSAKIPSFAAWRWGTLYLCCKRLRVVLQPLRTCWRQDLFAGSREGVKVRLITDALASPMWESYFCFVEWFSAWLHRMMVWGSACSCHQQEYDEGKEVTCPMKGRRLSEAYPWVCRQLADGLAECNAWDWGTWDLGAEILHLQGCVRSIYALTLLKLDCSNKLPFLLARLGQPGVARACLDQWRAAAPNRHHRM